MYRRDFGLSVRMVLSATLLLVLYAPFVAGAVYSAAFLFGAGEWLALGLAGAAVFTVFPFLSAELVLASAGARILPEDEAPELYEMLARLAGLADLRPPKLALMTTDVPNAFATGRHSDHGVVVVTTGLLGRLDRSEVEAVLAHELSHIATHDAQLMTALALPAVGARRILRWWVGTPLVVLFWVPFFGWILYALATLMLMTISRYRELVADRGAALITGAPEQLMSALQKIAAEMERIPDRDLREVAGMNAFFIVPAVGSSSRFEIDPHRLFPTHPPLERRLDRLAELGRTLGKTVPPRPGRPLLQVRPVASNWVAPAALILGMLSWSLPAAWLASALLNSDEFPSLMPLLAAPVAWSLGVFCAFQGLGRAQAGARRGIFALAALALLLAPLGVALLVVPLVVAGLALGLP